jgi:hypothetical protein
MANVKAKLKKAALTAGIAAMSLLSIKGNAQDLAHLTKEYKNKVDSIRKYNPEAMISLSKDITDLNIKVKELVNDANKKIKKGNLDIEDKKFELIRAQVDLKLKKLQGKAYVKIDKKYFAVMQKRLGKNK